MTQKDMAKKLGLSHPTLNRLEAGSHNTSLRVLEELCRALRCRPGDLFEPGRLRPPSRRAYRPSGSALTHSSDLLVERFAA